MRLANKRMWVVAPTGVAAINVDGITIHKWGNFGIGSHYSDFDRMMNKETRKKIHNTDVLLFDEISMADGHLFDVLECMVTIIRNYDDIKDRVKIIKSEAPIITENMGGSGEDYQNKEDCIMSSYMLKMRWEDPILGALAPWGGIQRTAPLGRRTLILRSLLMLVKIWYTIHMSTCKAPATSVFFHAIFALILVAIRVSNITIASNPLLILTKCFPINMLWIDTMIITTNMTCSKLVHCTL